MAAPAQPGNAKRGIGRALLAPFGTPVGVVLVAMLLVAVPVTTALFQQVAPIVLPFTLLSVVAFWLFARRVRTAAGLAIYSVLGGALAGYINCMVCIQAVAWLDESWNAALVAAVASVFVSSIGSFYGVAYGLAFAPLLLLSRRASALRPAEGVDRCLLGAGLWGIVTIRVARPVAEEAVLDSLGLRHGEAFQLADSIQQNLWTVVALCCAVMLVVGAARLAQRRRWLARVCAGKVSGWLVCPPEGFDLTTVSGLPEFVSPFWRGKGSTTLVLVQREKSRPGAYRSHASVPRFRVARGMRKAHGK